MSKLTYPEDFVQSVADVFQPTAEKEKQILSAAQNNNPYLGTLLFYFIERDAKIEFSALADLLFETIEVLDGSNPDDIGKHKAKLQAVKDALERRPKIEALYKKWHAINQEASHRKVAAPYC